MFTIMQYYKELSYWQKTTLFLRWITAPFEKMERIIPSRGTFLDVGSGAGLFDLLLVLKSPKRTVVGVEPDEMKYRQAQSISVPSRHLSFTPGYFSAKLMQSRFDGVVISDVLYLLAPDEKRRLLGDALQVLHPRGKIYLKTNVAAPSIGFWLCWLQEFLSVTILGITHSNAGRLYFNTRDQYQTLFAQLQLSVDEEIPLTTLFFHPHTMFVLSHPTPLNKVHA
jgi:SAM-dependent methyltransferase